MNESYIILVDMDDVLCSQSSEWIKKLNRRHGTNLQRKDLKVWNIGRSIPLKYPGLTNDQIFAPLAEVGHFKNLPIKSGVREGLEEMKTLGWRPVIVTSLPIVKHKPGQVVQEKSEWVEEHLSGLIHPRDMIVTYRKDLVKGDVLIDDAPHNLEIFPGNTIAFDCPWNRSIKSTARVKHWNEVVSTCKKIFED